MSETLKGIDISYTVLTDAQAERLKAAGWEVLFQCLWTAGEVPPPALNNLRTAIRHGLTVGGYISVNGSKPGAWHVQNGHAAVPPDVWDKLVLVPIDVELDGIPNTTIRDAVNQTHGLGKRRAIYSSWNCWVNKQGNPQTFEDCLLWAASWTGQPVLAPVDYGRWKGIVGQQWSGGAYVEGVYADRNLFVTELIMPKEEAMLRPIVHSVAAMNAIVTVATNIEKELSISRGSPVALGQIPMARWLQAWTAFWNAYNVPEADRILPNMPQLRDGALRSPRVEYDGKVLIWA